MSRFGLEPDHSEFASFPYDAKALDKRYFDGDEEIKKQVFLATEWMKEVNSGRFCSWEDVQFLRDHWDGPLVLKGIQTVEVSCIVNLIMALI